MLSLMFLMGAAPQQAPAPAPATAATPAVPPEALHMINPVKATPEGQARARKIYSYDCAVCHGVNGDGKGDIAATLKPAPKDWTNPATLQNVTDGEMFYVITNGRGAMTPEVGRAKPDEIWNMVIMVRSFAKK
ncbi:MAG: cytochrome c [Acidobacteriaceae bacterium]